MKFVEEIRVLFFQYSYFQLIGLVGVRLSLDSSYRIFNGIFQSISDIECDDHP